MNICHVCAPVQHEGSLPLFANYGLAVNGTSSTVQLVSPLTKEQVSLDNVMGDIWDGGGNWGAEYGGDINQIKTIAATTTSSSSVPCGETKSNHESPPSKYCAAQQLANLCIVPVQHEEGTTCCRIF